jgi:hypothetical protein
MSRRTAIKEEWESGRQLDEQDGGRVDRERMQAMPAAGRNRSSRKSEKSEKSEVSVRVERHF